MFLGIMKSKIELHINKKKVNEIESGFTKLEE